MENKPHRNKKKIKVLFMASLFYPQQNGGGPIISLSNLAKAIKSDFEIYIITKNHEVNSKKKLDGILGGWLVNDFGKTYYSNYGKHTFFNIINIIKQIKPDIIYQNSFFSSDDLIPVLFYAKIFRKKSKLIIAPRGEFCANRLIKGHIKKNIYTSLIKTFGLLRDVRYHATSEDEVNDIRSYLGLKSVDRIYQIPNLSQLSNLPYTPIIKSKYVLKLVYISRVHPTKNLLFALSVLKGIKHDVFYDIYGPLEDIKYWNKCEEEIKTLPSNISVDYKGVLPHDHIQKTLENYHAFFMPSIGENFGHAIVESLLCSRPVIISDKTPWSDLHKIGGLVISLDEKDRFKTSINHMCEMGQPEYDTLSKNARNYIDDKLKQEQVINDYISMFSII